MNRFADLERPPLNERSLRHALVAPGSLWSAIDVVESTGSTNADLRDLARTTDGSGHVLIAEEQVAGRGRLGRTWTAPARSALTLSVMLRPTGESSAPWGWLPLIAGLAIDDALRLFEVPDTGIKWPNDVLIGDRKLAGVLSERVDAPSGPAVIIGMGINVSLRAEELPTPTATSLALVGAPTDRDSLVRALLRALEVRFRSWGEGAVADLQQTYRQRSRTIGHDVHVLLPGGHELRGRAAGIDVTGGLFVDDGSEQHLVAAADITHARLA
jgi:BirA family transcriptional regulator, biotin operon repressor / biotin---[acetyl-CoA-carboxylase] ligase